MNFWVPVITEDIEICSNCSCELPPHSQGYIRIWWQYKGDSSLQYFVCSKCAPIPVGELSG